MARAVQQAIESGRNGGPGRYRTASRWRMSCQRAACRRRSGTVVVSTATIALQRQLIDRDLPRLAAALDRPRPRAGVRHPQGRQNYLCLRRLRGGGGRRGGGAVRSGSVSALGRKVKRLHESGHDHDGDRDELVPGVGDQAWRQVSVGAASAWACSAPVRRAVFRRARQGQGWPGRHRGDQPRAAGDRRARGVDIFPEHDVVIIDEAHDLVDPVTSVASDGCRLPPWRPLPAAAGG